MEEWQAPPWTLSARHEWIFSEPPYRGVLSTVPGPASTAAAYVQATVETPEGVVAASPFGTIKDAQTWAENEIYRRLAESGHELRRHGPGRRERDQA